MQPKEILGAFKEGKLSLEEATNKLNGFCELDFAKLIRSVKKELVIQKSFMGKGKQLSNSSKLSIA